MTSPPATLPGWLLAELGPVLRLAEALTGSSTAAEQAVALSLAREPGWARLDAHADPTPLLRSALLRTYLRDGGDPAHAAVTLRDTEQLTTGEIAGLLDRPPSRLAADLVAGGSARVTAAKTPAVGPAHAGPAEPSRVAARYPAARDRVRRQRRRRARWFGAGLGAVAALAVGVMTAPLVLSWVDPPATRAPGTWRFTHVVDPVPGVTVRQRLLTSTWELTLLTGPDGDRDPTQCSVLLTTADDDDPDGRRGDGAWSPGSGTGPAGSGRTAQVGRWRAAYGTNSSGDTRLSWRYAEDRDVAVSCVGEGDPDRLLLRLARAVRFVPSPVQLPFRLAAVPAGYEVRSLEQVWTDGATWAGGATGTDGDGSVAVNLVPVADDIPALTVRYGSSEPADQCLGSTRPDAAGRRGMVCLATWWSPEGAPDAAAIARRSLDRVTAHIRTVPDPADRTTWHDAVDLPG